ncbi:hypothetical protein ILYODFUR_022108 [Ilyodon furcidens]|uniref:Uncharacterized protein n=1 Tax=Ilyodon furcidens TaxID=33524 RepID=A0ABV0V6T5_9TELE
MMEDQIIVAVRGKPELYDSTNYFYRDKYRKDLAWLCLGTNILYLGDVDIKNRLFFIYSPKTDGQAFSSGDTAPVVGVPEADSSPNARTADLQTGSWIDGSTAEIDRPPDAAPGVGGGDLQTVPVPEESGEPDSRLSTAFEAVQGASILTKLDL